MQYVSAKFLPPAQGLSNAASCVFVLELLKTDPTRTSFRGSWKDKTPGFTAMADKQERSPFCCKVCSVNEQGKGGTWGQQQEHDNLPGLKVTLIFTTGKIFSVWQTITPEISLKMVELAIQSVSSYSACGWNPSWTWNGVNLRGTTTTTTSNKVKSIFLYGFTPLSFLFVWTPIIIPSQPSSNSSCQSSTLQNNENCQSSYVKQNSL